MKVKLLRQDEQSRDVIEPLCSLGMGGNGHIPTEGRIRAAKSAYRAAHDAAPDEATIVLEHHLHTVRKVLNGEASLNDLGGSYDALQAREETAALIEQAEERVEQAEERVEQTEERDDDE